MWARALIMGLALIGSAIASVFIVKRNYKNDLLKVGKKTAKRNRKGNIIFLTVLNLITIGIIIFSFPTYIFLSGFKLNVVLIWIFICVIAKLLADTGESIIKTIILVLVSSVAVFGFIVSLSTSLSNSIVVKEIDNIVETIKPTMFSENKIAYTCDSEGNIEKYFYYYNDSGKWKYKEFDESDIEIIETDKDTYIQKITTISEQTINEKKPSTEDYITEITEEEYVLYINYDQAVEITN